MKAFDRPRIKALLALEPAGQEVEVMGWVKFKRPSSNVTFVILNDGSTMNNIQVVLGEEFKDSWENENPEGDYKEFVKTINQHACIRVKGTLIASAGAGQAQEIMATEVEVYGTTDLTEFPIQKKKSSLEFLREIAHLRVRTNTFSAVFRIRHALTYAIHKYFTDKGFFNIHTPIITGSDTEGAGEMFTVTTLDLNNVPKTEDGAVNFEEDFFGKHTKLTVSGQLNGELFALGLGLIYTFGPTFRAENSNTSRHLAEFWMIEPEMAFYDNNDNQDLAEDFLKSMISHVKETCLDDLKFLDARIKEEEKNMKAELRRPMGLLETLDFVLDNDFERITYTDAINLLRNSKPYKKKKFEYPVEWGVDMQAEHERWLVEKKFKKPVIVTDYPKDIKAFYMKMNEDGKTVRAMDVLFPGIGEIIGGSQREEELDKLMARIHEMELPEEHYWWYLDTRKFGTAPHSGFGLGFERLMLFLTGMGNIRDVVPFPRTPKNAEF